MIKNKISAVVNVRNESKNLDACLKTLRFCHEIVVCDMESEDDTIEIAKKYTDKIFSYKNVGFVEPARNFAIKKAIGDWILIVDADERIPKSLADKLIDLSKSNVCDYVYIPRQNFIFGKWIEHSRWWPDDIIRFFKKGSVVWQDQIHSIPKTTGTSMTLTADPRNAIIHYNYISLDDYLSRMIRYSNQQAKELVETGYKFDPVDTITKPVGEFIGRFFANEGYKDGFHGLSLSFLQAFSILVVYLKVWEIEGQKAYTEKDIMKTWQKAFNEKAKELRYWLLTIKIGEAKSKTEKFILRLKRKANQ